ncbi:MAG: hypothetical protein KAY24_20080 [Candidatus Eisenbacteria sp.]|nr:hypothetical protein [Candidatus Eisenbacteria bacterium]
MGRDYEAELRAVLEKTGEEAGIIDSTDASSEHVETIAPESERPEVAEGRAAPFSSSKLFVHHDTHPVVLDIKLIDQYGTDWFEWEPETLWREIMDDFRTPSISDHVKSKIQAMKTIHITDWAFSKWEVFCPIIQALNNNIPDFEVLRRPTVSQLFVGVDMMTMVRADVPFSPEVQKFCAASLLDAGVICAPQPISFCQDEIVDFQNERGIPVDPEPVRDKYRRMMSVPAEEVVLEETPIDIQIAKLIVARDYLQIRRDQMKHQLRLLR